MLFYSLNRILLNVQVQCFIFSFCVFLLSVWDNPWDYTTIVRHYPQATGNAVFQKKIEALQYSFYRIFEFPQLHITKLNKYSFAMSKNENQIYYSF